MAKKSIEELERIIATSKRAETIEMAKKTLAEEQSRLADIGAAQIQAASQSGSLDPKMLGLLEAIKMAIKPQSGGGSVDINQVRQLITDELHKRKISEDDLTPSLKSWLNASRKVVLTIDKLMNFSLAAGKPSQQTAQILENPLMQLILSDLIARNNVYLYGGAGTGKTFIAEQVAELLGWEAIVLNCNQFTSPLDILGGQTIDGYQEGKVSMAWSNIISKPDGTSEKVKGCVLILDELPKIDPNTAGILNQALAKVKDFKYNDKTGTNDIPPTIRNGRNEILSLGNLFVIATGNVPLNTIDPDYEANFKQDLSLQDRFIGSTYKVFVNYRKEYEDTMKGYAFIWIFMTKVREEIIKLKGTSQGFVSLRVMINMKATYYTYRSLKALGKVGVGNLANNAIDKPKTLKDSIQSFFDLFKASTKQALIQSVDLEGFLKIVEEKDKMPFDPDMPNFNTPNEEKEAMMMITLHDLEVKKQGI